jgi:hypothetical protein
MKMKQQSTEGTPPVERERKKKLTQRKRGKFFKSGWHDEFGVVV